MNEDGMKLLLIGLGLLALGLSGWLLPHRWNLLRLRGAVARHFSEGVQKAIPRVVGTFAILGGLATLLLAAAVGLGWLSALDAHLRSEFQAVARANRAAETISVEVGAHEVENDRLTVRGTVRNDGQWRVTGLTVRLDVKSADGTVVEQDWERVVEKPDSFSPGEEMAFEISAKAGDEFDGFDCGLESATLEALEEVVSPAE